MSNFYTDVSILGNNILYRGYENGKRVQYKTEYSPKVYVKTHKKTEWKNLFDQYVMLKTLKGLDNVNKEN